MSPEPPASRVSMRDIATQVGMSHATVSMALRDNPRISAPTREKIKKAAEALGYHPDPMLTALAMYRNQKSVSGVHSAVAWINAWENPEDLRRYKEFDFYWTGASQCAAKLGYRLEEFRLNREMTPQRLHRVFQARNIRGILLPPHGSMCPAWEDFPWSAYSVVRFGRSLKYPQAHLVTADQLSNTFTAVSRMRERGYHRIGMITYECDLDPRGPHFTAGFLSARELLHDTRSFPIFQIEAPAKGDLVGRFQEWMEREKPDALLSTVEQKMLMDSVGCRVPADIPVAVTSLLDGGADSGMDQHPEEIGRLGLLLLSSLINDAERGIPKIFRQVLVEGSWVDGTSLPDRRQTPGFEHVSATPEMSASGSFC